ncbi:hypothetical protein IT402_00775 [Candidatus Nomurabacteria bacterium]|nr:hypothetical protein [Candidatus Nomurabacteria bacterium]
MTYEQPPAPEEQKENLEELNNNNEVLDSAQEDTPEKSAQENNDDYIEEQVKIIEKEINEKKRLELVKDKNLVEEWDSKTKYNIPPEKPGMLRRFTTGLVGLATMLGFAQKANAGNTNPEDSLGRKPLTEKINPADSIENSKELDLRKYEKFGISHIEKLESNDKENDIFLVSINEYKSYGDVLNVLKKASLTPVSTEKMDEAVSMNQELFKKAGSVMSLSEVVNKLGNPSYNTITWDKKANAFHGESREIQVMKAKKGEAFSNFDSDYDRYNFIVKAPKEKTTSFESGLAKK